jgi:hypothetical protein
MARQVNDLLSQYILVHDNIFKFSLRKLLPIPGLFKAINYCKHEITLSGLENQLQLSSQSTRQTMSRKGLSSAEREFFQALHEYSDALRDSVHRLREISTALCHKSRGAMDYSMAMYNRDTAAYNDSVMRYTALGERLNSLYHRLPADA